MSKTDNKPCPFCGSTSLSTNLWSLDGGEVDAIECLQCYAGAPLSTWNAARKPLGEIFWHPIDTAPLNRRIVAKGNWHIEDAPRGDFVIFTTKGDDGEFSSLVADGYEYEPGYLTHWSEIPGAFALEGR